MVLTLKNVHTVTGPILSKALKESFDEEDRIKERNLQAVIAEHTKKYGGLIRAVAVINPVLQAKYGEGVSVPEEQLQKVIEEAIKIVREVEDSI